MKPNESLHMLGFVRSTQPTLLTIAGKDGDEAKPYLEKQIMQALKQLERLKEDNE